MKLSQIPCRIKVLSATEAYIVLFSAAVHLHTYAACKGV